LQSIEELNSLLSDPTSDHEIKNLASEDVNATTAILPRLISRLKRSLIPPHPFAALPCLLEIHPGAGGSEASLFAGELLHMYTTFCASRGWKTDLVKYEADESTPGSEVGLTDAVLEVTQPGSYDVLKGEAGVHRVQRVPATEKKGRTHTSAVSVLVLPSLPAPAGGGVEDSALNFDDPNSDYYVNPGDVRSETMRARGAGGQHVNKTDSAIRLTHIPTGMVVSMQESRSQHKNRATAWQILRAKLAQKRREEREQELNSLRRRIMGGVAMTGREDKVRTYNYSQQRVTDHRCGSETGNLPNVLEGGGALERVMSDVREWMQEQEVAALAAEEEVKAKEWRAREK
jgi:peptide chain release factor 1